MAEALIERGSARFHADTREPAALATAVTACYGKGNDSSGCLQTSTLLCRYCAHLESPRQETTGSAVCRQRPTHSQPVQRITSFSGRILSCCLAVSVEESTVGIKFFGGKSRVPCISFFYPFDIPSSKTTTPPSRSSRNSVFIGITATQIGFPGLQHIHSAIHEEGNIHSKGRGCHVATIFLRGV